jgi:glycine cleavage system protein P-like pyridoxal-binding family
VAGDSAAVQMISGNRGLQIEEKLLFEQDSLGHCGVDLPEPPAVRSRLGGLDRKGAIGLPGLSEPQVVRHFTRLSQKNYAIDSGLYPLGSCTMKHNPRLNEKMARLPGFADVHPLQPAATVQGALELIDTLAHWLKTLTGMPAIALSPAAGAHGELCGMMTIRAALEARGDKRSRILVPESAHGTNPATAAACGYSVEAIPANERGRVDLAALRAKLGSDVAALMLTNPNTCGLFEDEILEIAAAVHDAGAFFYCDGANFNAIVGRVRPAELGIDALHINLHKTFSTPHGGGGPGSGPVALANYLRVRLAGALSLAFPGICMHEVLFDDGFLKDTGVSTLDFAKALIDEGFHPMTMYFPLVVHGALLIEPTETESRASLDQFAAVVNGLAARAQSIKAGAGEAAAFHAAPRLTPRRRLDETAAARKPVLRWRPAPVQQQAAE